jgi:hypothetical protein
MADGIALIKNDAPQLRLGDSPTTFTDFRQRSTGALEVVLPANGSFDVIGGPISGAIAAEGLTGTIDMARLPTAVVRTTTNYADPAWITELAATKLTGTVASARLTGAYTGITGLGTLTALTVTGAITVGGAIQSSSTQALRKTTSDGFLWIGGDTGPTLGANYYLYGSTNAATPDRHEWRQAATVRMTLTDRLLIGNVNTSTAAMGGLWVTGTSYFGAGLSIGKTTAPASGALLDVEGSTRLAGNVAFFGSPIVNAVLYIRPNPMAAGSNVLQYGIIADLMVTSTATTSGDTIFARLNTPDAVFTMGTGRAISIGTPIKGAASTITTYVGLEIAASTVATTNFAIRTLGATPSAFGGSVAIGKTTAPTATLDVAGGGRFIDTILVTSGAVEVASGFGYRVAGRQVVGARIDGWGQPSGIVDNAAFDTETVSLVQLARRVRALIEMAAQHGLIGLTGATPVGAVTATRASEATYVGRA